MSKTLITHNGETRSIAKWAEVSGIKPGTLARRLQKGVEFREAIKPESRRQKRSGNHYKTTSIGNQKVIRDHILVVQRALGKPIPKGSVVHHIDGDINNNANSNLVLCQSHSYHAIIHARDRALKESGDANKRKCVFCKTYDNPENMQLHGTVRASMTHRECYNAHMRAYQAKKRAAKKLLTSGV
jgi:hypothetical protein